MQRKVNEIKYSPDFLRHLLRLPRRIVEKAKEREQIFQEDAFDPRLRIHKLHGKEKESWAFWIDYTYRIKFVFLNEEAVLFLDVGAHDIYR